MNYIKKGFTLIELLVVIAILGILATVVLAAVNPLEQLAKTRDSSRTSTVAQLGHAMESYGTSNNGAYITPGANWISGGVAGTVNLVSVGEITTLPASVTYGSGGAACTSNAQNGYCYKAGAAGAAPMIVYARLEAKTNTSKCLSTEWAYAIYTSADGRGGIICTASGAANEPAAQSYAGAYKN